MTVDDDLEAVIDGVRYDPRYCVGMMRPIEELERQRESIARVAAKVFAARATANPEQAEALIDDALRSLDEGDDFNASAAERLNVRRAKFILE